MVEGRTLMKECTLMNVFGYREAKLIFFQFAKNQAVAEIHFGIQIFAVHDREAYWWIEPLEYE